MGNVLAVLTNFARAQAYLHRSTKCRAPIWSMEAPPEASHGDSPLAGVVRMRQAHPHAEPRGVGMTILAARCIHRADDGEGELSPAAEVRLQAPDPVRRLKRASQRPTNMANLRRAMARPDSGRARACAGIAGGRRGLDVGRLRGLCDPTLPSAIGDLARHLHEGALHNAVGLRGQSIVTKEFRDAVHEFV